MGEWQKGLEHIQANVESRAKEIADSAWHMAYIEQMISSMENAESQKIKLGGQTEPMAKISTEQRAVNLVKLMEAAGKEVKKVTINGSEISVDLVENNTEAYDPSKDLDNIDWSQN